MIDEANRKQTSLSLMKYFQESFGEADILDEYDLYFDIRNDILVVTLLHRRYWDEDRVILYNLVDHTIDKEVTIDRKSTRLNSSHVAISYAVFCLKKKK